MEKKEWNSTRDEVSTRLAGELATSDPATLQAFAARGLSDWMQNMVQTLKLKTPQDKAAWASTLTLDALAKGVRVTHEALNAVILEGVAAKKISAKQAAAALAGKIEEKQAFIAAHLAGEE